MPLDISDTAILRVKEGISKQGESYSSENIKINNNESYN